MARINGEIFIARPPEVVFDCVSDQRNEPKYNPGMVRAEKLTPGARRRGHPIEVVVLDPTLFGLSCSVSSITMSARRRPAVIVAANRGHRRHDHTAAGAWRDTNELVLAPATQGTCPPRRAAPGRDGYLLRPCAPGRAGEDQCRVAAKPLGG